MKILVCISKTPETTAIIEVGSDGKSLDTNGVNFILNPYDEWYALVRALELKEQLGGQVTVINVGLQDNDIIIRKALAIGADDAIRINKAASSAEDVAYEIHEAIKDASYDLVLTGKETIDFGGSLMGSMLSELLGLPFVSYVNHLEIDTDKAKVTREIEGGIEVIEAPLPLVVSAAKGMAEQRIPNMRGIMMAKRKPLNVLEPTQDEARGSQLIAMEKPEAKKGVTMIDPEHIEELVRLLHEEAKII